jgi:hypothetical protein
MAFRRASEGLVAMNLASWLGYVPTPSDRVGLARDCQRLADMGLLERHNLAGGARTTHLRLTEAGRKVAEGILGAEEPPIATGEPLDLADLDLSSLVLPEETDAPATP